MAAFVAARRKDSPMTRHAYQTMPDHAHESRRSDHPDLGEWEGPFERDTDAEIPPALAEAEHQILVDDDLDDDDDVDDLDDEDDDPNDEDREADDDDDEDDFEDEDDEDEDETEGDEDEK